MYRIKYRLKQVKRLTILCLATLIALCSCTENAKEEFEKGEAFYKSGNYEKAISWYKKAAKKGYADAQNSLAYCYAHGKGISVCSYSLAIPWYKKAAEQGHVEAQYNLGYCYAEGKDVPQDYKQAVYWYKKAAEKGDADAQYDLGYCYAHGKGVNKDYKQAIYWSEKSAKQGKLLAQKALGDYYEGRDNNKSLYWYRKAADRDDEYSQYKLGMYYYKNNDYNNARYWLEKSAEEEYAPAEKALKELEESISNEFDEERSEEENYSSSKSSRKSSERDELLTRWYIAWSEFVEAKQRMDRYKRQHPNSFEINDPTYFKYSGDVRLAHSKCYGILNSLSAHAQSTGDRNLFNIVENARAKLEMVLVH